MSATNVRRLRTPHRERVDGLIMHTSYLPDTGWRVTEKGDCLFIQHIAKLDCTVTGSNDWQRGRKWFVSEHSTDEEIIRTMRMAILAFEEHEMNENFKFRGERVLNPHPEGHRDG